MLGRVNAKINVIDQIISFYNAPSHENLDDYYDNLNASFANKQQSTSVDVQNYLTAQLKCMGDSMTHSKNANETCPDYETKSQDLLQTFTAEAAAMADRDDYMLNPRNKGDYVNYLNSQKTELNGQRERLFAMLGEMDPLMGGILDADQLAIANLSDTYKDDNWLQFSFDSQSDYEHSESSSSHESISASGGVHFLFFHIGGSYTHTKDKSHYEQQLARSGMKAKGKLLRVNIKRPWFKPEIFEDSTLNFVRCIHMVFITIDLCLV